MLPPGSRLSFRAATGVVLLLVCTAPAQADGGPPAPGTWWRAWDADPLVLFNLSLLAWLYLRGVVRIRRTAARVPPALGWRFAAFGAALLVLAAALLSPLDPLADELASAHMGQHLLLMMIAAPLFVAGLPGAVVLAGLPRGWRKDVLGGLRWLRLSGWPRRLLWQPVVLWCLYAVVLWAWHLPALYEAALRYLPVHDLQHLTFFLAGCLFWRLLLDPAGERRLNRGVAVLYLFTTSVHASVLGVFMALSPRPWYPAYGVTTPGWGLTPLEDQQLAGLLMWVPACLIYPAAAAGLFGLWLAGLTGGEEPAGRCRPGGVPEANGQPRGQVAGGGLRP